MENHTILVVEDDPLNLKLVASLLKMNKYIVLCAEDAQTGIQMALEHKPDLILMDIQLPVMDGLSATKIIKNDPVLQDIPVVALTGCAMRGDDVKFKAAGCDGYISKPFGAKNFLKIISQFLQDGNGSEKKSSAIRFTSSKNRIMIVDDDPKNIKVLKGALSHEEYEIITANGGQEALNKVAEQTPDLILLDIMMPDIDGYEVTKRLKNDPESKNIPIIMVTNLDKDEDKIKALAVGAEELINKPVNVVELSARMNSMLKQKQYKEQLSSRRLSEQSLFDPSTQEGTVQDKINMPLILLVEDDEKDVNLIQSYLHKQPYRLICVSSAEEALTLIQKEKIDVILLDILLPGLNGFDFCLHLDKMEKRRTIPIIVLTCLDDMENKLKSIELGIDDYLIKPVNSLELKTRIDTLLKKKEYMDGLISNYETALDHALIDNLTNLYNHRYLMNFLNIETKRSIRYNYPIGLIIIDIDNFKQYNDNLGHLTGDMIIKEIAQLIKANIREVDVAARYGGDEFIVVLPYAIKGSPTLVAERIQRAVNSHIFCQETSCSQVKLTVSMGISQCPLNASTSAGLINKADKMLYEAKKGRKNKICIYDSTADDDVSDFDEFSEQSQMLQ